MSGPRIGLLIAAVAACIAAAGDAARAVENSNAYLICGSCGSTPGALPPPGFYFANTALYADGTRVDGQGRKTAINIAAFVEIPRLLWVPEWQLLDASVGFMLAQPLEFATVTAFGSTFRQTGAFNTVGAGTLSWRLPNDLYASGSLSIYAKDGQYNAHQAVDTANNYWTFEPDLGISWLHDGWNLSFNTVYDINTRNPATAYHSGSVLFADVTVGKSFGRWTAAVVADAAEQVEADDINGVTVAANAIRSAGNKFRLFGGGPLVGRDFGPLSISAYYTRDIFARNAVKGEKFWISFGFRL